MKTITIGQRIRLNVLRAEPETVVWVGPSTITTDRGNRYHRSKIVLA